MKWTDDTDLNLSRLKRKTVMAYCRKPLLFLIFMVLSTAGFSQNVGINATGAAPSAWAMLDIAHSTKGLLIPRVALSALNNAAPIGSGMPVSMLVYNTATAGTSPNNVVPGYYYWDGSVWVAFAGAGGKNWSLSGNGGTVDGTHFLGTTDNVPLSFRVNNKPAGRSDHLLHNAFWGYLCGVNTTAPNNIGLGDSALYTNTSGDYNSALGCRAMVRNTMGQLNVALGYNALASNTMGSYNAAIGPQVMQKNISGNNNTAIGNENLYNNSSGTGNTSIGTGGMYSNGTGNRNVAVGTSALYTNTGGSYNTAIGADALLYVTTATNNIAIGYNAQVPVSTTNNQIRMGNASITYAGVQVAWSVTSDKRWKTDIKPSDLGLNFIKALRPVFYIRENDPGKKTEYGFIAQEVESLLNVSGAANSGLIAKDDEGLLSMRYNDLLAPMVKAIQEQQALIEALQLRNKELELRLGALEKNKQGKSENKIVITN